MTKQAQLFNRDSGILLHPSSLPSAYGIGDFGPAALAWLDALAGAGQNLWQILPLNPAGYGDSPYQGLSAFAANPVFLSAEDLHARGLLTTSELRTLRLPLTASIDYGAVYAKKLELSTRATRRFLALSVSESIRVDFQNFLAKESAWLPDFALFSALKSKFGGVAWTDWPTRFRDREPAAIESAKLECASSIERICVEQFFLFLQWQAIRAHARDLGVRIIGDLPIFVAHDSADVWCHHSLFRLNADGSPEVVAGVPPDYFSSTGQLWGNPLYSWEAHRADGFTWWRARLRKILEWVDIVRIDHFRGFDACWEIPGGAETAAQGRWIQAPGAEVFEKFVEDWGYPLPVIAEDLGVITEEVVALRERFHLPGLRIEQFAFGSDSMKDTFIPEAYDASCVAYTGTHDNDTVVGWFNSKPGENSTRTGEEIESERRAALEYFGGDGSAIHWDFIERLYQSAAAASIVPIQDILGLGSESRMNTPGMASGSWRWRAADSRQMHLGLNRLAKITEASHRGLTASATACASAMAIQL